jgi:dienelactone hydrolase
MSANESLAGWKRSSFSGAGLERGVYRRGSGPAVIVIHEIPGITPAVIRFANEVVERGCTVVMPDLVGTPGKEVSNLYLAQSSLRMCVAREFTTWALDRTSPIVAWLRALAAELHAELGGPGVGAVGMCFSGGFALGMMVDATMVAPVLSQPSLPLARPGATGNLGLSPDDEAAVIRRAAEGCQVLGLRFVGDRFVGTRFDTLHDRLGEAFVAVELASAARSDHSVLTEQRDDAAVERVLDFLVERLHPGA